MDRIIDGKTGGQFAAFNYLGFGVLLLLATTLWVARSEILSALREYWGITLVLLALTLFALSNRVYVGKWEVLKLCDNPPRPLSAVRKIRAFLLAGWLYAYGNRAFCRGNQIT